MKDWLHTGFSLTSEYRPGNGRETKNTGRLFVAGIFIVMGISIFFVFGFGIVKNPFRLFESVNGLEKSKPEVSSLAPEFKLQSVDGQYVELRDLQGTPIIVNFWATWCAPCVIEMPILQRFYERYGNQLIIVAINADEPESKVRAFVEDQELTYPVLLDPGSEVQELYNLRGYPTSFFIDGGGTIRVVHIGTVTEEQVSEYLLTIGLSE